MNGRLQGEHARLIDVIRKTMVGVAATQKEAGSSSSTTAHKSSVPIPTKIEYVIADMMAGVGPFAVPLSAASATQRGIHLQVFANGQQCELNVVLMVAIGE
jgi:hypothetical protein